MQFIQTFTQNIFSSTNISSLFYNVYRNDQRSKDKFFATKATSPKMFSIEQMEQYFDLQSQDIREIFLSLKWIEITSRGYFPTKEGCKQGAREKYDNYESSTLWDESILLNEALISKVNIKINQEVS